MELGHQNQNGDSYCVCPHGRKEERVLFFRPGTFGHEKAIVTDRGKTTNLMGVMKSMNNVSIQVGQTYWSEQM